MGETANQAQANVHLFLSVLFYILTSSSHIFLIAPSSFPFSLNLFFSSTFVIHPLSFILLLLVPPSASLTRATDFNELTRLSPSANEQPPC